MRKTWITGIVGAAASLTLLTVGCSERNDESLGNELGSVKQTIVNAPVETDAFYNDRVVQIFRNSVVWCTGTLLRPDVVLTGAHCVGGLGGSWVPHSVRSPDGRMARVLEITELYPQPTQETDSAMLRLDRPLAIDGQTAGVGTEVILDDSVNLVGNTHYCSGYNSTNTLRGDFFVLSSVSATRNQYQDPNPNGSDMVGGDSGGPCFDSERRLVDTMKDTGGGKIQAHRFIDWMHYWLRRWDPGYWSRDLDNFDYVTPRASNNAQPEWEKDCANSDPTSCVLRQNKSIKGLYNTSGAHAIYDRAYLSDVQYGTWARATSDTTGHAGVFVRYRDSTHFYRFRVGTWGWALERQYGASFVQLATGTDTVDWSDGDWHWIKVRARRRSFHLYIDGALLAIATDDSDNYISAGRVGLYNRLFAGVEYQQHLPQALCPSGTCTGDTYNMYDPGSGWWECTGACVDTAVPAP